MEIGTVYATGWTSVLNGKLEDRAQQTTEPSTHLFTPQKNTPDPHDQKQSEGQRVSHLNISGADNSKPICDYCKLPVQHLQSIVIVEPIRHPEK